MRLRVFALYLALLPGAVFAQSGSQVAVNMGSVTRKVDPTKVHLDQLLGTQVPLTATFKNEQGKTVRFGDLLDNKPAVILPIFYRCKGVCGLELQGTIGAIRGMTKSQMGRDFDVIVVSIHPKETPDLAAGKRASTVAEVAKPETDKGWRFLVGDWGNIHQVTDSIGFHYTYDEARDAIDHPSGIVFVTPKGVVSSYIYGSQYSPALFEKNLDIAKRYKVGEKAKEIFFGCVHVDPLTGRRSIVVENVLKVFGGATLFTLVGGIAVLSNASRKRRKETPEL